jgi:hypothetical protein
MLQIVSDLRGANATSGAAQFDRLLLRVGFTDQTFEGDQISLPATYGLYTSPSRSSEAEVSLSLLAGDTPFVTRNANVAIVEGRDLFYRVSLTAACDTRSPTTPTCSKSESCIEGVCRPRASGPLEPFDPQQLDRFCHSGTLFLDALGLPIVPTESCPGGTACIEGSCRAP